MKEDLNSETSTQSNVPIKLQEPLDTGQLSSHSREHTITHRTKGDFTPLSFAQQRLWFLDQLQPNSTAYLVTRAFHLKGPLNHSALEQSLNALIARHESLRTTFKTVKGNPVQVIAPSLTLALPVVDLQGLQADEQEGVLRQRVQEEASNPFDLSVGPLIRATILEVGPEQHVFLLTLHHIITDGWSMEVFCRELSILYEDFCGGLPSSLSPLPIQYADYAVWQRQRVKGDFLRAQLNYWKKQLTEAPALKLPIDHPRPVNPSHQGARWFTELPQSLRQSLKELSQRQGVTLFMAMLAAFKVLLFPYTEQEDVVVGVDNASRTHRDLEGLIGFFVNLLVLRTNFSGNPTFGELLHRIRKVTLEAYNHQDLPFDQLVAALRLPRIGHQMPLVRALLSFQNFPSSPLTLSEMVVTPLKTEVVSTKVDLTLFIFPNQERMGVTWQYNTDLFKESTIKHMARAFTEVLEAITDDPNIRLKALQTRNKNLTHVQSEKKGTEGRTKLRKLGTIKRRAVDLSRVEVIKTGLLLQNQRIPLMIQPARDGVDLGEWAEANRENIEEKLLAHGGILFRGFPVKTILDFEAVATAICPKLFCDYGDLPREGLSHKVYGSTPYPADQMILFHNESSHLNRWPMKQLFFCVQPATEGGETPIVDCREVYRRVAPAVLEPFIRKGLMYVRNFHDGFDVRWQDFFHTDDKSKVEELCQKDNMQCQWIDGNQLRVVHQCQAVAKNPKTGDMVFFNQLQLHHASCLDPSTRQSLLAIFAEDAFPRHVYYGDGSSIEDTTMSHIDEVYRACAIRFPWEKGDILLLENMLTAHARSPYKGSRQIAVAMGEMMEAKDLQIL